MGHIRKRGTKWAFVIGIGYDEHGKRHQKWYSGYETRTAAKADMTRLENDQNKGCYVAPVTTTVTQHLESWLRSYAKQNVAEKTYERYECIITKHICPALGPKKLSKLQPTDIQSYYTQALEGGRLQDEDRAVLNYGAAASSRPQEGASASG